MSGLVLLALSVLVALSAAVNVVVAWMNVRNARRNKANAQANLDAAKHLQRPSLSKPLIKADASGFARAMDEVSAASRRRWS